MAPLIEFEAEAIAMHVLPDPQAVPRNLEEEHREHRPEVVWARGLRGRAAEAEGARPGLPGPATQMH